jgi:hypothetical protein
MKWRTIDKMIVSACIQRLQREINEGDIEASELIPDPSLNEERAKEFFNAWRVYLIDRMMKEYDRNDVAPMTQLEYDIEYFKSIVAKEKEE